MDSALKQRLIGAVVLIALGIIFIPMLLDGPKPSGATREVNLEMPAEPEPPASTRLLPVDASIDTPLPLVAVDANPRPAPIEQPTALEPAPDPEPVATAPIDPVVSVAPAPKPTVPVAPAQKPTPTPLPRADGRYALQLGIYANLANLGKIKEQLRGLGVATYEEDVMLDGKSAKRLRAGPYASRASAESDRAKITLNAANLPLALINLPSGNAPASAPAPGVAQSARLSSGWAVQVGIFSSLDNANKLRDRLVAAAFPAFVSEITGAEGKSFRVRVGPELKRESATALKDRVNRQFTLQGFVVAHP